MKNHHVAFLFTLLLALPSSHLFADSTAYVQTNLVSDVSTEGAVTVDPNLTNPWGMSFSSTSPIWISNEMSSTSTAYSGAGAPTAIDVKVPGGPTGQVFNTAGGTNFPISPGGAGSNFIFDTLSGTIQAWNGSLGVTGTANTVVSTTGAVYTGLAIGAVSSSNYVYAANFTSGGGINVFDSNFNQVNSTTFANKFVDSAVPAGYAPFNIQQIGNDLYVEYAEVGTKAGNPTRGLGLGYVGVFDMSGNLIQTITSAQLDAPWGVAIAPAGFGEFSGDLLVGNFGNGEINAFDSMGNFVGTLDGGNGNPIVDPDLWALDFRTNGGDNSVANALYFDAGINGQNDGLFGYIDPAPEPSVYGLAGLGLALIGGFTFARKRKAADRDLN